MNSNTVRGFEALSYLTSVMLADKARIIEHNAGIDIDNGARPYDHERVTDAEHLFWITTMYAAGMGNMPSGYTPDDLFSLEYVVERTGNTDTKTLWFHVHEDIYDGESRGTHFEFLYPTVGYVNAEDVYAGMEVDLSADTDGEYDWHEVDSKWRSTIGRGTEVVHMTMTDDEDETYTWTPNVRVRTRTWH